MSLSPTAFTNGAAATTASANSASKTWTSGHWFTVEVLTEAASGVAVPTVTINSTALTQIQTTTGINGLIIQTQYCFLGDGSTGVMNMSTGAASQAHIQWEVNDWGVLTAATGTNGINAVVQHNASTANATNETTTLSAFADSINNAAYISCSNQGGATQTPVAGYTGLSGNASFFVISSAFKIGQDLAPAITQASANNYIAQALEVSAGGGGGSTFVPCDWMHGPVAQAILAQ